jgi:hypothetical protein
MARTRVNYITDSRAAAGTPFNSLEVIKEIDANRVGDQSTTAPTTEIGAPAAFGIQPWSQMWLGDPLETVPALQWPASVQTYAAMMTDSQIDGLLLGSTLPIRRYKWFFNPNGCDPAKVKVLAADFNLPLEGEKEAPRGRLKKRFSHDRNMFHAFKAMGFGFYYMEIVGEMHDDGLWHLTKLSPRPPLTIMDIALDRHGELLAIRQNITQPNIPLEPIPNERLAKYVWEQEGANYTGRAMIRSLYKNWMIKDRLLRVDALKHERNGMGVPWATGAPGMGKADLQALNQAAQRLKAGDTSGAAGPAGSDMKLLGVQGALPDTIASINYHDEAMSRRFLMMFLQLGSTVHGSRALGSEFIDYFQLAQESIANWYRDATNEDVVENWWDWNFGETGDTVPILEYKRDDDPRVALESLDKMVREGVVRVDDELEEAVRQAMDLPRFQGPARELAMPATVSSTDPNLPVPGGGASPETAPGGGEGTSPAPSPATSAPGGAKARRYERTVAAKGDPPLPSRSLRRQIYTQEAESKVNLAAMDAIWQQARDTMFANWKEQIANAQIDELVEEIGKTSDISKLGSLEATPAGQSLLVEGMEAMYNQGVQLAAQEYEDQGLGKPKMPESTPDFSTRASAIDNVSARALSNMASSRALSVSGGNLTKAQVASHVHDYLDGLTHMMMRDRISGALTAAMNDGRRALMASSEAPARYYSSEILDVNTCSACASVDGTQYESLEDTEQDYPGGGFVNCEGGDRCRGTIIAVYQEANTRTEEDELES